MSECKFLKEVSVVKDGWEAIQFFDNKAQYNNVLKPDLVLLDMNMPKMNGREVLTHIWSNEKIRRIPVIIFTTSLPDRDISLSTDDYLNCYIAKPVDADEFLNVVSAIENFLATSVQRSKHSHQ